MVVKLHHPVLLIFCGNVRLPYQCMTIFYYYCALQIILFTYFLISFLLINIYGNIYVHFL